MFMGLRWYVPKKEGQYFYCLKVRSCLLPFEKHLHIDLHVRTVNNCNIYAILVADSSGVVTCHAACSQFNCTMAFSLMTGQNLSAIVIAFTS